MDQGTANIDPRGDDAIASRPINISNKSYKPISRWITHTFAILDRHLTINIKKCQNSRLKTSIYEYDIKLILVVLTEKINQLGLSWAKLSLSCGLNLDMLGLKRLCNIR